MFLLQYYALLVKSWEQKVFPVIRRRFRNEAERKDGLEQIKGALQLGILGFSSDTPEKQLYERHVFSHPCCKNCSTKINNFLKQNTFLCAFIQAWWI